MAEAYFRGSRAIAEVLDRLKPLSDYLTKATPSATTITLKRRDYDLIRRWPRAAGAAGFLITGGNIFWGKFRLKFDLSQGRYED